MHSSVRLVGGTLAPRRPSIAIGKRVASNVCGFMRQKRHGRRVLRPVFAGSSLPSSLVTSKEEILSTAQNLNKPYRDAVVDRLEKKGEIFLEAFEKVRSQAPSVALDQILTAQAFDGRDDLVDSGGVEIMAKGLEYLWMIDPSSDSGNLCLYQLLLAHDFGGHVSKTEEILKAKEGFDASNFVNDLDSLFRTFRWHKVDRYFYAKTDLVSVLLSHRWLMQKAETLKGDAKLWRCFSEFVRLKQNFDERMLEEFITHFDELESIVWELGWTWGVYRWDRQEIAEWEIHKLLTLDAAWAVKKKSGMSFAAFRGNFLILMMDHAQALKESFQHDEGLWSGEAFLTLFPDFDMEKDRAAQVGARWICGFHDSPEFMKYLIETDARKYSKRELLRLHVFGTKLLNTETILLEKHQVDYEAFDGRLEACLEFFPGWAAHDPYFYTGDNFARILAHHELVFERVGKAMLSCSCWEKYQDMHRYLEIIVEADGPQFEEFLSVFDEFKGDQKSLGDANCEGLGSIWDAWHKRRREGVPFRTSLEAWQESLKEQ
ncbi:hypothetical protein BSKO_07560 [Bryopsis sp. KO-2023]|nr:hypothetical protein BSKO_07560 [Bryopsis sp. KO-2023]